MNFKKEMQKELEKAGWKKGSGYGYFETKDEDGNKVTIINKFRGYLGMYRVERFSVTVDVKTISKKGVPNEELQDGTSKKT